MAKKPAICYFDNAATTPMDKRVIDAMLPYMTQPELSGNASSTTHSMGAAASKAVEMARRQFARSINCSPTEIYWTSGATEANNIALLGLAETIGKRVPRRIISCKTEHSAVLEPLHCLKDKDFELTFIPVNKSGAIDIDRLRTELAKGAALASFMYVNNETGVIHPIEQIGKACRKHGVPLHVDATQALGKIEVDLKKMRADLVSFSAHKFHGPKGIGALFVRKGNKTAPIISGGGQERGLRPGTLPVPQIVGAGTACSIAEKELNRNSAYVRRLHDSLCKAMKHVDICKVNGDVDNKVPHILNLCFKGIKSGSIVSHLADRFAISTGAACSATKERVSHVLVAMGVRRIEASSSIRISMSKMNTKNEVDRLSAELSKFCFS